MCPLATERPVFSVALLLALLLQLYGISLLLKVASRWPSKGNVVYVANSCLFAYFTILTHFFLMHLPQATMTKGTLDKFMSFRKEIPIFLCCFFLARYMTDLS